MAVWGEMGVETLDFGFATPKRHFLARNHVKLLSADFAAASKNNGKTLCCLLKIDITSVIDANENEHTS